jgi:hypothetical protein
MVGALLGVTKDQTCHTARRFAAVSSSSSEMAAFAISPARFINTAAAWWSRPTDSLACASRIRDCDDAERRRRVGEHESD